ncbi:MAG TPA: RDD family protein [Micromonosporaceae bacterium]
MTTPPPPYGYPPQPGYPPPRVVYAPPPVSPAGAPLAEFEKRLLGYVIDSVIQLAVQLVVLVPVWVLVISSALRTQFDPVTGEPVDATGFVRFIGLIFFAIVAAFAWGLAFGYLYHVEYALRQGGQTVGKRVAKVRIVPLDPHESLTRRHLTYRFLTEFGMRVVSVLAWIDGLWQLWDKPYRQCLHDKAARTVVVRLDA